jgi:phage terminase large subunit-like protein
MNNPHVEKAERYAKDVLAGKVLACKWVQLACQRHFNDKSASRSADCLFRFDAAKGERVAAIVEQLPHTKGKWADRKEPFILEPWQCFMVVSIFGWVWKRDGEVNGIPVFKGRRRFRRAMLLVPRKNGKSELAARIGNYMLAADGEHGAEVVSGATSEEQAMYVFKPARMQVEQDQDFREQFGIVAMKSNLHVPSNGSTFQPIIGKPGDGAGISCGIVDEYHEHETDALYDAIITGMAAREQPLALVITTAGDNLSGPCFKMKSDLEKVLDGTVRDEFVWGINYTIDDEDDWVSDLALRKANPNYGKSVIPGSKEAERAVAMRDASKQGTYKTKQLNVWVGAKTAYFNIQAWRMRCYEPTLNLENMKGRRLTAAMDLASIIDIAAVALLFELQKDQYALFMKLYVPIARTVGEENAQYAGWVKDGLMTATEGERIDYTVIEEDILAIHRKFGIQELAYDPQYAEMLRQRLDAQGVPCVELRPVVANFSEPMKTLAGLILDGHIKHSGSGTDPMSWMMANVVAKYDNKDNVYPNKERPEAKIDGPVALIMSLAAMAHQPEPEKKYQLLFVG